MKSYQGILDFKLHLVKYLWKTGSKEDEIAKMSKKWASTKGVNNSLGTKLWKESFKRLYGLPRTFTYSVGTKNPPIPCFLLYIHENLYTLH